MTFTWQDIKNAINALIGIEQVTLGVGGWLLALLALAGISVLTGRRMTEQSKQSACSKPSARPQPWSRSCSSPTVRARGNRRRRRPARRTVAHTAICQHRSRPARLTRRADDRPHNGCAHHRDRHRCRGNLLTRRRDTGRAHEHHRRPQRFGPHPAADHCSSPRPRGYPYRSCWPRVSSLADRDALCSTPSASWSRSPASLPYSPATRTHRSNLTISNIKLKRFNDLSAVITTMLVILAAVNTTFIAWATAADGRFASALERDSERQHDK